MAVGLESDQPMKEGKEEKPSMHLVLQESYGDEEELGELDVTTSSDVSFEGVVEYQWPK